jgi:hypothetical protein
MSKPVSKEDSVFPFSLFPERFPLSMRWVAGKSALLVWSFVAMLAASRQQWEGGAMRRLAVFGGFVSLADVLLHTIGRYCAASSQVGRR